jgi:hypothetical protein
LRVGGEQFLTGGDIGAQVDRRALLVGGEGAGVEYPVAEGVASAVLLEGRQVDVADEQGGGEQLAAVAPGVVHRVPRGAAGGVRRTGAHGVGDREPHRGRFEAAVSVALGLSVGEREPHRGCRRERPIGVDRAGVIGQAHGGRSSVAEGLLHVVG